MHRARFVYGLIRSEQDPAIARKRSRGAPRKLILSCDLQTETPQLSPRAEAPQTRGPGQTRRRQMSAGWRNRHGANPVRMSKKRAELFAISHPPQTDRLAPTVGGVQRGN